MNINLIQNDYSFIEAKELVLGLIDNKINSLRRKNFSVQERTGSVDASVEKRIQELEEDRKRILSFLDELDDNEVLGIDCQVKIDIRKNR